MVVALLLNHVVLAPGEAVFLGAGNLHAYLRGAGVEIMANSDNVVRGGLTTKHIDVEELLTVVDCTPIDAPVQCPTGTRTHLRRTRARSSRSTPCGRRGDADPRCRRQCASDTGPSAGGARRS